MMRTSKNCIFSTIVNQLRFRDCENIKTYTLCTTDPAVESSFNIYFAPYNAFFPHLKEIFIKAKFQPSQSNHINSPYDFTPDKVMGDGAPHYLMLPEGEFKVEEIKDGDSPIEEIFDGYSKSEPLVYNIVGDKYAQSNNITPSDGFEFVNNNDNNQFIPMNENNMGMSSGNDNNQFISMDNNNMNTPSDQFSTMNNQFIPMNENNMGMSSGNDNNQFMSMDNNNNQFIPTNNTNAMNFNNNQMNNNMGAFDYSSNVPLSKPIEEYDEEEIKRQQLRNEEAEERARKIREKIDMEMQLKNKRKGEAMEFMNGFNIERQQKIEKNRKNNQFNEDKAKKEKEELKSLEGENVNHWELVTSNIALKEGDYKGKWDVSRMRQCIINRKNDKKNK